jgi:hypothetical protein
LGGHLPGCRERGDPLEIVSGSGCDCASTAQLVVHSPSQSRILTRLALLQASWRAHSRCWRRSPACCWSPPPRVRAWSMGACIGMLFACVHRGHGEGPPKRSHQPVRPGAARDAPLQAGAGHSQQTREGLVVRWAGEHTQRAPPPAALPRSAPHAPAGRPDQAHAWPAPHWPSCQHRRPRGQGHLNRHQGAAWRRHDWEARPGRGRQGAVSEGPPAVAAVAARVLPGARPHPC